VAWAVLVVRRDSDRLLTLGLALNLATVALWAASRTVGVPIAPHPWVPEEVGVADTIATISELVVAVGVALTLLSARSALARRASTKLAPALLTVLALTVSCGVGAHAG
jgi:hypothetical protein